MALRIATLFLALFLMGCAKKDEPSGQACGGITGAQCPTGQTCVDDPTDTCDPTQGGADCAGTCK
ncbi:MAG: hypothetical protein ACREWG_15660 [Gammaproteobacteria bacterium]